MAATLTTPAGATGTLQTVYGAAKLLAFTITGDNPYASGGYAITPAVINAFTGRTGMTDAVSKVDFVIVSAVGSGTSNGFARWNAATGKIQFFPSSTFISGPATELGAVDATGYSFNCLAVCE